MIGPIEALHYGHSQPVSVITGVEKPEILAQALRAVKTFKPFTAEQTSTFLAKTRDAALTGNMSPSRLRASLMGLRTIQNG
jgi:hypothetical protein